MSDQENIGNKDGQENRGNRRQRRQRNKRKHGQQGVAEAKTQDHGQQDFYQSQNIQSASHPIDVPDQRNYKPYNYMGTPPHNNHNYGRVGTPEMLQQYGMTGTPPGYMSGQGHPGQVQGHVPPSPQQVQQMQGQQGQFVGGGNVNQMQRESHYNISASPNRQNHHHIGQGQARASPRQRQHYNISANQSMQGQPDLGQGHIRGSPGQKQYYSSGASPNRQGQAYRGQGRASPRQRQYYNMGVSPNMQAQIDIGQGHSRTPGSAKKNQGQNKRQGPGQNKAAKRKIYEEYWSREDVQKGLKLGTLVEGALRVNPKNYQDSYIPHPDGQADIYISGMKDRNRALNGDIVAVFLYPKEDWKVLTDSMTAAQDIVQKLSCMAISNPSAGANKAHPSGSKGDPAKNTDKIPENKKCATPNKNTPGKNTPNKKFTTLADFASSEGSAEVVQRLKFIGGPPGGADDGGSRESAGAADSAVVNNLPMKFLMRTGKVVYIIEKKHSRASSGNLRPMQDKNPNLALFAPSDARVPRIIIPMNLCPQGFLERPEDHASTLYIARITKWDETSNMPMGELARSLGEAGEIEPETEAMLIEYDVDHSEFSDETLKCLPQNLPWRIPEEEFSYRRDLRKECIFTIDPATARDLDDAVHCNHKGSGIYEVGVHIADVSYFLKEDNALDEVASQRATSVYLVQKVIPMLPRLLCEQLCSLNPDEDRLTFSVIWTMTEEGEILDEWFGRSVIRSCVKLSYDHAQGFIEQPDRDWTTEELPPISTGTTVQQIKERVLNLNKIAVNLRKKRFHDGALRLDQVKLQYTLDKESGLPNGYFVYQQKDSNRLIEEFMLLANMAVAHKIHKAYPGRAMLRRHPPPQSRMVDEIVELCSNMGVPVDASSAGTLQRSLNSYLGEDLDAAAKLNILTVLWSKPMQNARYFCTGMIEDEELYRHYALNVPLYTHFTSPIRRYADVVVHRLLAAALEYTGDLSMDDKKMQRQAENCNDKKTNSKSVQERSAEMFFSVFVKECGPLEEDGMVMGVLDHSFDVLVLKLGVVKRVYTERLPLKSAAFHKEQKKPVLTLIWAADEEHPKEKQQVVTIFTKVRCVLKSDNEPLRWSAIIKHPEDAI